MLKLKATLLSAVYLSLLGTQAELLINNEGIVVDKDLRGPELRKRLEELLN